MGEPKMGIRPFKLAVTVDCLPHGDVQHCRWETGTMNLEGAAGITAAIEYIAGIGARFGNAKVNATTREKLVEAFRVMQNHEDKISRAFLEGMNENARKLAFYLC